MPKGVFIFLMVLFFSPYAIKAITFYKDIRPIVENRCLTCHSDAGVSFSMDGVEVAAADRRLGLRVGVSLAKQTAG